MTIALAKDVEDFLQKQIREGHCTEPSELVNDLIRSIREQQVAPLDISPELEGWLLEAADGPTTPLTPADFEGIRERVRSRTSSTVP